MVKCFFIFVLISVSGYSQTTFFNVYSNQGFSVGQDILVLPDTTYLITGRTTEFNQAESQLYAGRLNKFGQLLWSKDFGLSGIEEGKRIISLGQKAFFLGSTSSTLNGDFEFLMVQSDLNGNFDTSFTFGTPGWDWVEDAVLSIDSSLIIVGSTNASLDGEKDGVVYQVDTLGNILNSFQTNLMGEDVIYGVVPFSDSSFLIGGHQFNTDSNFTVAFFTRMNWLGDTLWHRIYGGAYSHRFLNIELTSDGLYGVGDYLAPGDSLWHEYYIRCAPDGTLIEANESYDIGSKIIKDIIQTDVNTYYLGMDADDQYAFAGGTDVGYFKFTESLDFAGSAVEVKALDPDVHGAMKRTIDNGFIAIGSSSTLGNGEMSIYILKAGPNATFPNTLNPQNYALVGLNEDESTEKTLIIYPNPFTDILKIQKEASIIIEKIVLRDTYGRKLLDVSNEVEQLDLKDIHSGIYLLELHTNRGGINMRQVVKK